MNCTVKESLRIAKSRNSKNNPDGWSPVTRLLHLRLRVMGALYKRMADGSGIEPCYKMYFDARRDVRRITLNKDEEEWLETNGIDRFLQSWNEWKRGSDQHSQKAL